MGYQDLRILFKKQQSVNKMKHDAYRQAGYIQQALSQNRKPVGVFLGVGCPLGVKIEHSFSNIEPKKEY